MTIKQQKNIPNGFVLVNRQAQRAVVRLDLQDILSVALLDNRGCQSFDVAGGRGKLLRFPLEDGHGIIRRFHRGGAVRFIMKDRFFLVNRPLNELTILEYLFNQTVSVPEPLGVCWERKGAFIRGAIATKWVDARDLLMFFEQKPEAMPEILLESGKAIRRMHDLGVVHADLQARNILIGENKVYLIDFDKARRVAEVSSFNRAKNLLRLRRSFEKNNLTGHCFKQLCEGYGVLPEFGRLDMLYRMKGRLSDIFRMKSKS